MPFIATIIIQVMGYIPIGLTRDMGSIATILTQAMGGIEIG